MIDSDVLLKVDDVKKSFFDGGRRIDVLKGINLDVYKSDTISIMGVSGAGKTTLLQIIGSLDNPTSGGVLFKGGNIFNKNEKELSAFRNKNIGFVFQAHRLLMEFDILENIMMPVMIAGVDQKQAKQRAEQLVEAIGMKDKIHNQPSELSGGEQQKVAVARALIMSPLLLLADEPTGNLDSKSGEAVIDLLLYFNKTIETTIIIVTHNEVFAHMMTRRYRINDGILV